MATPNYDIDREGVKAATDAEMNTAIKDSNKAYDDIIAKNEATEKGMLDKIGVMDENGNWNKGSIADIQTQNANKQTELAIDKIEQGKEWAQKDYIKEQSGAYKDWQKQSNQYGANAEQMAAQGLTNTGYSESSQVAMYTAYQNRVAVARESYQRAVVEYDTAIAEARAQNSSVLAEIAASALEKSLQITLSFAQQNNTLLTEKVKQKQAIQDSYYQRYLAELDSIIKENTLKEQVRQFNADMDFKERQFDWQKEQAEKSSSGGSGGKVKGGSSGGSGSSSADYVYKQITGKNPKGKTTSSSEKEPTVNKQSLIDAGLAGRSAAYIDKEVKAGRVIETEKDGQLYYTRVFNGTKANGGLNYTNATKGKLPTTAGLTNPNIKAMSKVAGNALAGLAWLKKYGG